MSEGTIDADLVRHLVASQFPRWAHHEICEVATPGWDNRTFHLGDAMLVRLPSHPSYAPAIEAEQRWLPWLAERLSLAIPRVVGVGRPDAHFPRPWSVHAWIDGVPAAMARGLDLEQLAVDLAEFLLELRGLDANDGPKGTERAGPLAQYDDATREAITRLGTTIDGSRALDVWEAALAAPMLREPAWFHGDVAAGNLLMRDGRLAAVIDFGRMGIGDASLDTTIAWTLLDASSRRTFREVLGVGEAAWARGRGLALWKGLIVMAGMCETNAVETKASPVAVRNALRGES